MTTLSNYIYINNKKKKFKCPLYGLSPQSRSQSDSGKHKEYTMYYTKPVPINWDTRGSFDLQRHGKEHTSRVMCLKDTQLQKPLRQSQWGPTHWMSRWMFFSQRNMTKSCTVHVLYTAKKKKVVPTHRQHKVAQLAAYSWWPCSA